MLCSVVCGILVLLYLVSMCVWLMNSLIFDFFVIVVVLILVG